MKPEGKKIAIYVPAYNAARTLEPLLKRIPPEVLELASEILVVDDASEDETYAEALRYREVQNLEKLSVLRLTKNKGYSGNQKTTYRYLINRGFDVVVMLHGDAQYAPEFIPALLGPVLRAECDYMIGSRITGKPLHGRMPLVRYLANRTLTLVQNFLIGSSLSEFHSGYRAYDLRALQTLPFEECMDRFHCFDTDILIQLKLAGFRAGETTVPTHYSKDSRSLRLSHCVFYGLGILWACLQCRLVLMKLFRVRRFRVINHGTAHAL